MNINLFGQNGSGKSTVIEKAFTKASKVPCVIIDLCDFSNFRLIYKKIIKHFKRAIRKIPEYNCLKNYIHSKEVVKFSDLYDLISDFECIHTYIVK